MLKVGIGEFGGLGGLVRASGAGLRVWVAGFEQQTFDAAHPPKEKVGSTRKQGIKNSNPKHQTRNLKKHPKPDKKPKPQTLNPNPIPPPPNPPNINPQKTPNQRFPKTTVDPWCDSFHLNLLFKHSRFHVSCVEGVRA